MSSPALYLLDTNIISELRKTRPHGAVKAWFKSVPTTQIAIPAIVIGEIQAGVEATRLQDKQKALEIEVWLEAVLQFYKILPMDGPIFRQWAKLMFGKSDAVSADAMIAATALEHRLVVATRNTKDFERFAQDGSGPWLRIFNPFDDKEGARILRFALPLTP